MSIWGCTRTPTGLWHATLRKHLQYDGGSDSFPFFTLRKRSHSLSSRAFSSFYHQACYRTCSSIGVAYREQRGSGFAIIQKARRPITPNRVRFTTDRCFVFSCSPHHLTGMQLLSTLGLATYPDTDFHRVDATPSESRWMPRTSRGTLAVGEISTDPSQLRFSSV